MAGFVAPLVELYLAYADGGDGARGGEVAAGGGAEGGDGVCTDAGTGVLGEGHPGGRMLVVNKRRPLSTSA